MNIPASSNDSETALDETQTTSDVGVGNSNLLPDPRHLLLVLWRRLWLFLLVAGGIIAAVVAYATLTPKAYTATSSVQIEAPKGDPIQPRDGATVQQAPSSDFIDTQILVLDSNAVRVAVVRALDLTNDPEFGDPGASQSTANSDEAQNRRVLSASQKLGGAVTVRRVGQTSLIEIAASSLSPARAAQISNEFGQQYLNLIAENKHRQEDLSSAQVDGRLDKLRGDAERADGDLQRYKIANGLMSAEGATMAEQETSALNQQIAAARAALAVSQGRLSAAREQVKLGGGGGNVSSALNSGTIGALRQQEAESSRTLAQLRVRYGSLHPSIAQEEQRLADVRRQIQLEIDRVLSSLEGEVHVAQSNLASLVGSQQQSRSRLAGNASAQVGYMELERKATAARTIYEAFLNRSKGAAARDGIDMPGATIGANALVPTAPSSPNTKLAYLVGTAFALLAGLLAVAVAEFLDGGIRTKIDVEKRLGARYLGAIPDVESTLGGLRITEPPQDYIVSHPLSTFAEALRSLRATATLRGNRRPKVIALTSALPREGKTTTAVCLARALAMSGATTILVDCDLRRHSASDIVLDGRPGRLSEVLAGTLSVEAAVLTDTMTDLSLLCTSEAAAEGRDLLAPELIGPLLADLRTRYEFVIIDTAPVLGIADARAVAHQADAVILLARWGQTSLRAADTALDLLIASQAKVIGVALTMVDIRKYASTGHEDLYGYHKKFKGYYVN